MSTNNSKRNTMEPPSKMTVQNSSNTHHFWSEAETAAYVDWINLQLGEHPELKSILPISKKGVALFQACHDGVLLAKLVNSSVPDTINESSLNSPCKIPIQKNENLTKVIEGCRKIGVQIHNIAPSDIIEATPHLCLGIIWQIIKVGLLANVKPVEIVGSNESLDGGTPQSGSMDNLTRSHTKNAANAVNSNERALLRWFNNCIKQKGYPSKIGNFGKDLKDSAALATLVAYLTPQDVEELDLDRIVQEPDLLTRAEAVLDHADKFGCRSFTSPQDIVDGNKNLNMAFVAVLYNNRALAAEAAKKQKELEVELENAAGQARKNSTAKNQALNELEVAKAYNVQMERELQKERAAANETSQSLNDQVKALQSKINELEEENGDLQKQVTESNHTENITTITHKTENIVVKDDSARAQQLERELLILRNGVEQIQSRFSSVQTNNETNAEELMAHLQDTIDKLEQQTAARKEATEAAAQENQEKLRIKEELDEALKNVHKLQSKNDSLISQNDTLKNQVEDLQTKTQTQELVVARSAPVEGDPQASSTTTTTNIVNVTEVHKTVISQQDDEERQRLLKAQQKALEMAADELTVNSKLSDQLDEANSNIADLQQKLSDLQNDNNVANKKVGELSIQVQALKDQNSELKNVDELAAAKKQIATLTGHLQELEEENSNMKNSNRAANKSIDELREKVDTLVVENARQNNASELEQAHSNIERLQSQLESLASRKNDELEAANSNIQEMRAMLENMTQVNENLQQNLDETNKKLASQEDQQVVARNVADQGQESTLKTTNIVNVQEINRTVINQTTVEDDGTRELLLKTQQEALERTAAHIEERKKLSEELSQANRTILDLKKDNRNLSSQNQQLQKLISDQPEDEDSKVVARSVPQSNTQNSTTTTNVTHITEITRNVTLGVNPEEKQKLLLQLKEEKDKSYELEKELSRLRAAALEKEAQAQETEAENISEIQNIIEKKIVNITHITVDNSNVEQQEQDIERLKNLLAQLRQQTAARRIATEEAAKLHQENMRLKELLKDAPAAEEFESAMPVDETPQNVYLIEQIIERNATNEEDVERLQELMRRLEQQSAGRKIATEYAAQLYQENLRLKEQIREDSPEGQLEKEEENLQKIIEIETILDQSNGPEIELEKLSELIQQLKQQQIARKVATEEAARLHQENLKLKEEMKTAKLAQNVAEMSREGLITEINTLKSLQTSMSEKEAEWESQKGALEKELRDIQRIQELLNVDWNTYDMANREALLEQMKESMEKIKEAAVARSKGLENAVDAQHRANYSLARKLVNAERENKELQEINQGLLSKQPLSERQRVGRMVAIETAALDSVEKQALKDELETTVKKFDEASILADFLNGEIVKLVRNQKQMDDITRRYQEVRPNQLEGRRTKRSMDNLAKEKSRPNSARSRNGSHNMLNEATSPYGGSKSRTGSYNKLNGSMGSVNALSGRPQTAPQNRSQNLLENGGRPGSAR